MAFNFDSPGNTEDPGLDDEAIEALEQGAVLSDEQIGQADEVVQEYEQSSLETSQEVDAQMSAVEKRLDIASYYKTLLNDRLFTNASPAAKIVETEIRTFVRGRLGVLLGLQSEPKKVAQTVSQFTPEEVAALKLVAAKITQKPAILQPTAPTLKKTTVTEPRVSARTAPGKSPAASRPAAQPVARPAQTKKAKPRPQPEYEPEVDENGIWEENGKKYRWEDGTDVKTGKPKRIKVCLSGQVKGRTARRRANSREQIEMATATYAAAAVDNSLKRGGAVVIDPVTGEGAPSAGQGGGLGGAVQRSLR